MRSREAAAAVLSAGAFGLAAAGAGEAVARSGIPRAWDGTVTRIEARHEKHPGIDDVWYVAVDGRAVHVDSALATSLRVGDRVEKRRWQRSLRVNGTERRLALSRDARAMLAVAPVTALMVVLLAYPRALWTRARTRSSRTAAR